MMKKLVLALLLTVPLLASCDSFGRVNNINKSFDPHFYTCTQYTSLSPYEEYYCKETKESIRLYENGIFEYVNCNYSFTASYQLTHNFLRIKHGYFLNDTYVNDDLLFEIKNNQIKQIDGISKSGSGFSLNNRTFTYHHTGNNSAKYRFDAPIYTDEFSIFVKINNVNEDSSKLIYSIGLDNYIDNIFSEKYMSYSQTKEFVFTFKFDQLKSTMLKFLQKSKSHHFDLDYGFIYQYNSVYRHIAIEQFDLSPLEKCNDASLVGIDDYFYDRDSLFSVDDFVIIENTNDFDTLIKKMENVDYYSVLYNYLKTRIINNFFEANTLVFLPEKYFSVGSLIKEEGIYFKDQTLSFVFATTDTVFSVPIESKNGWWPTRYPFPFFKVPKSLTSQTTTYRVLI